MTLSTAMWGNGLWHKEWETYFTLFKYSLWYCQYKYSIQYHDDVLQDLLNFNSPITWLLFATYVRSLAILVQKCINSVEMHILQCSVRKNLLSRKNSCTLQNKTTPLIPKNRAQT